MKDIDNNHTFIDFKQFEKGIYFIEIYDELLNKYHLKKIVKL